VSDIAAKLADALSMFWQSLDERERRLLVLGTLWLGAMVVAAPLERNRREREQSELAERIEQRLAARLGGRHA
jgi:hypothetical protein